MDLPRQQPFLFSMYPKNWQSDNHVHITYMLLDTKNNERKAFYFDPSTRSLPEKEFFFQPTYTVSSISFKSYMKNLNKIQKLIVSYNSKNKS